MAKLTETEGVILAELLLKLTGGNENLANEIIDVVHDMVSGQRSIETEIRKQENIYQYVSGW